MQAGVAGEAGQVHPSDYVERTPQNSSRRSLSTPTAAEAEEDRRRHEIEALKAEAGAKAANARNSRDSLSCTS